MIKTHAVAIKEDPRPPEMVGVTLTLTRRDAEALMGLVGRIGGPYDGTSRDSYSNIYSSLLNLGLTPRNPRFDRDRTSPTGTYVTE
jgi:hypothetical protein